MADAAALPKVKIYRMYYTFCEDPGCGALNDYADDRKGAERNRRRHLAAHRNGDEAALRSVRMERP